MKTATLKQDRRIRRKTGIRKQIFGTPERPRLTVYRSLNQIYAQIIDDLAGKTLVSVSTVQAKVTGSGNKTGAAEVGKLLAQKAKDAGLKEVSFDRNGFKFHGRIKALADAAREGGLKF